MQTTRTTRSTVLGKRGHQDHQEIAPSKTSDQLATPESTPKRARTTTLLVDGQGNKENIPPLKLEALNMNSSPASPRATRALRRTATEVVLPSASRQGERRQEVCLQHRLVKSRSLSSSQPPPPTPPTILLPLHGQVKSLLRATSNKGEMSVAGRENERAAIQSFLNVFFDDGSMVDAAPTSLFISGSPGTGKTALVNSVVGDIAQDKAMVLFINCMALKTVDALRDHVCQELRAKQGQTSRAKKVKAGNDINSLLRSLGSKCLLILDELDHIASSWESLASLFSLSESSADAIRIIGIANTHTLTVASSKTIQTLHFAPYTPTQLHTILQTRLASLYEKSEADVKKLLPNPPLVLLTKKIANLTGDVRSLFEVLRGAIDLAVAAQKPGADANPLDTPPPSVTPQHILAALKAYAPSSPSAKSANSSTAAQSAGNSEIIAKISNLGLQGRIVLLSLLLAAQRVKAGLSLTGAQASPRKSPTSPVKRTASAPAVTSSSTAASIDTQQLFAFYNNVLDRSDFGAFDAVSRNDFGDLLGVLEGVGLVQMSSSSLPSSAAGTPTKSKRGFGRTASFGSGLGRSGAGAVGDVKLVEGVWTNEVLRGLGISESSTSDDLRNEEIKGLWISESHRLAKEVKVQGTATPSKPVASFEDAFER
ncbi:Cdc6B protein [Coprinopsis sp. MPI-PUGE-AT-0042]|nr:Cdc6B protein [Coprinopsis sp. MPI-PUGE-AT-0042]